MSSRALTVTLNYNHSQKFALLLPSEQLSREILEERILREARNKFRVKTLCSIFLQGGVLLGEEDAMNISTVNSVWVGKGEPYAGPPKPSQSIGAGDIRIISTKSYVDDMANKQLQSIAKLPGVRVAVGMPDLHPGSRFPIGCAIASEGIYPALIGSDVGCGMALYRLSASASRARANPKTIASLLTGLDEPWSGSTSEWLASYGIQRASEFDSSSLGTVGSGNHFAEICTTEKILDREAAASLNINEGGLYLLVHTGSRGLGASILARETAEDSNPYIPPDSPHLQEYLADHDYAVQWAVANRDLVAYRIMECISGRSETHTQAKSEEVMRQMPDKILDVTHNSVTQHWMTSGEESLQLWVHRKGAAPADKGVVPCPGSRGDFSWLLQPIGDGQHNAHSLAHGAGRRYGRQMLHKGTKPNKSTLTTTAMGSEVVCMDSDLLVEERPEAYKDILCVVEDMEVEKMCRGVVVLRPIVTYKVREGGREGDAIK